MSEPLENTVSRRLYEALRILGANDETIRKAYLAMEDLQKGDRTAIMGHIVVAVDRYYRDRAEEERLKAARSKAGLSGSKEEPGEDEESAGITAAEMVKVALSPAASKALGDIMLETASGKDEVIQRALIFYAAALQAHRGPELAEV